MKDGYYLSTYLYINSLAYVEKVPLRHDQNLSLWKKSGTKIELVRYWELERITGLKQHERAFYNTKQAYEVIAKLLAKCNITLNDIVEIWGTPQLDTTKDYHSLEDYPELSYHSLCHLFSALLLDSNVFYNHDMITLAVDGAPDNVIDHDIEHKNYYCGCYSRNGEIIDVFPVYSPGVLWGLARDYFREREGTLMALASACNSKLYDHSLNEVWVKEKSNVSNVVDNLMDLFKYVERITVEDEGVIFNGFDTNFTEKENKISMVMKVIQEQSHKIIEANIDYILQKYNIHTPTTYLALSGGYALNCPTNSYLMNKYHFAGFIAPPCVNDSGLSLGTALYAFYKKMKNQKMNFYFKDAYYGDEDDTLNELPDFYQQFIDCFENIKYDQLVEDIVEFPVVWFQGSSEIGPRALGNRSIIADPRSPKSKDMLNKIKQRQWWRPVAPIILEEDINEWFEQAYPSPYMLHTFKLRESQKNKVSAIAHLDESARVQTINKDTNPQLYATLVKFKEKYGVPILCNTSLNDKGEPIINTIQEALNFALRKRIKVAYINGKRIQLKNHDQYGIQNPLNRPINFDNYLSEEQKKLIIKELNPHKVSGEQLLVIFKIQNYIVG